MPNPGEFAVNAVLCDLRSSRRASRLYKEVVGTFWEPNSFQSILARISLAAVVTQPYTMTNQNHMLAIQLRNEDNETVAIGPPVENDGEVQQPIWK